MSEQVGKKRDWIKNAIIVFLIIMLFLTFFSNTIMNYSLPEVSAQYISNGTIQAKVRGNGVVQAGNPYSVKSEVSRTIMAVAVKDGAHVQKGDVLFYLEEGESTELKEALKVLEDLQEAYRQKALAAEISPEDTNKILNGQFEDFNTYYVQVQNLKNEVKTIEDEVNLYQTEVDKVKEKLEEYKDEDGGVEAEQKEQDYKAAKAQRETAEKTLSAALTASGAATVEAADQGVAQAKTDVETAQSDVDNHKNSLEYLQAEAARTSYENAVETAKAALEAKINAGDSNISAEKDAVDLAITTLDTHITTNAAYTALAEKESALAAAQGIYDKLMAVVNANSALETAKAAEENAKKLHEAAGSNNATQISQLNKVISINEEYIGELNGQIAEKQKQINELLTRMTQNSEMQKALDAIADQKEKIAKLRGGTSSGNILAPISGTVGGIMLKAGDSTPINGEVATIIPEGTGYTMEVTVTKEQAQRLSKGDVADVQNAWYYSDVAVVLEQIKTDKSDPANSRILVFHVEGDVADGQSLSISIGQKSANYDCLVPNSAVREDNNGKFILKVSQKSSPLGNRYYAERVDVEVLASDDTQSAIKGALEGWEFVITTSTKPVEAGQLIRLQD